MNKLSTDLWQHLSLFLSVEDIALSQRHLTRIPLSWTQWYKYNQPSRLRRRATMMELRVIIHYGLDGPIELHHRGEECMFALRELIRVCPCDETLLRWLYMELDQLLPPDDYLPGLLMDMVDLQRPELLDSVSYLLWNFPYNAQMKDASDDIFHHIITKVEDDDECFAWLNRARFWPQGNWRRLGKQLWVDCLILCRVERDITRIVRRLIRMEVQPTLSIAEEFGVIHKSTVHIIEQVPEFKAVRTECATCGFVGMGKLDQSSWRFDGVYYCWYHHPSE